MYLYYLKPSITKKWIYFINDVETEETFVLHVITTLIYFSKNLSFSVILILNIYKSTLSPCINWLSFEWYKLWLSHTTIKIYGAVNDMNKTWTFNIG